MAGNIATAQAYIAGIGGQRRQGGASFMKFGSDAPFLSGSLVMLIALTLSLRVTKSASEPKTERII